MVYELQKLTEDADLTAPFYDGALSDPLQAMPNLDMFFEYFYSGRFSNATNY